jgi:hypothetical protein
MVRKNKPVIEEDGAKNLVNSESGPKQIYQRKISNEMQSPDADAAQHKHVRRKW